MAKGRNTPRQRPQRDAEVGSTFYTRLINDPVAFFAAIAAGLSAISTILAYEVTHDTIMASRLDNAPALYLDCKREPPRLAGWGVTYFPIVDPYDYLGAVNQLVPDQLTCDLTNISKRPLVKIRVGFVAYFFGGPGKAAESWPPSGRYDATTFILPDYATYKRYGGRIEELDLAPNTKATFYMANGAPKQLQIIPAEQAEARFPGDDDVLCTTVYTAPGTLWTLYSQPMPIISSMSRHTLPPPPTPAPAPESKCLTFTNALAHPEDNIGPAVAPGVTLQFKIDKKHRTSPWLQVPQQ